MSTIAPESAAQLLFLFFMVMLMVNPTPVLSSLISDRTSEDGVIVGKGPAVSVGVTVQVPELLPVVVVVVVVVVSATVSFLQASIINGTEVAPIRKFFRNFFLECSMCLLF